MLRPVTALAPKMSDWKNRVKVSAKGLHIEAFKVDLNLNNRLRGYIIHGV